MHADAPPLTVAVIHRLMRGYPQRCLRSLVPQAPEGTEFLLLTDDLDAVPPCGELAPGLRVLPILSGDRASAMNKAVDAARGEYLLIVSADFVASPGAVGALLEFLRRRPAPALASRLHCDTASPSRCRGVACYAPTDGHSACGSALASAQILYENGMCRRTSYPFPSLLHEMNPVPPGVVRLLRPGKRPPQSGPPRRAAALRAFFLAGRTQTFRAVGGFRSGYRFGFEDVEWSWRAALQGVERWAVPEARAHCLAPQLHGGLSGAARLEIERSRQRVVAESRGAAYAFLFRSISRAKAFALWIASLLLNRALCGRSALLANAEVVYRALWTMKSPEPLPDDAESRVRWDAAV